MEIYTWNLRPEILLPLTLLAGLFVRGWWTLRNRGSRRFAVPWRIASFLGGLVLLALALVSPLDRLGYYLFFMSMIQHLILLMFAPPLLLLANPLPIILWALPAGWRRAIAALLRRDARFRKGLRQATKPGLSWMAFVGTVLAWHDAVAYDAALRHPLLNDVQNAMFFLTACLFWWHVLDAGPRIHGRFPWITRVIYLVGAVPFNMLLGVALAFSTRPWYRYYTEVPRLWDIPPVRDQAIGGLIMWIPGSMMYLLFALIFIARYIQLEADKPPLPESEWATHERMAAPR